MGSPFVFGESCSNKRGHFYLHALVDFENVQPSLEELAKLAPGFTGVWLFHGPHQAKQAQQLAVSHERVTLVAHSGKGKNALDFHLSFYLGYVAAKHPAANLVVVVNDKGYDSMIGHANVLGFTAKRVGFKAKKAPAVKKATPAKQPPAVKAVAKKVAPPSKPAPAKKAAAAKTPVPAKKVPAKKAAVKQAPAKNAPAKKALAAKSVAGSTPAKKPAAKLPPPAKSAALPKPVGTTEAKELGCIRKGLAKMGDKRPHKLKSFLRHVESMLGKDGTPAAVEAVVQRLEQEKLVRIAGDLVLYG